MSILVQVKWSECVNMFSKTYQINLLYSQKERPHMFAGSLSPGAALIIKSCGTYISANIRDRALSNKIYLIIYFVVESKSQRSSKLPN